MNFKTISAALTAATVLASGCAALPGQTYVELGAGHNDSLFQGSESLKWNNAGTVGFYGSLRQEWQAGYRTRGFCQYSHYSQWLAGPPFNDKAESSLDHVGCGVRFRLSND